MSFIKKVGLTLLAATSLQSQAASVWKVTSGENTLYIGGTIHLLTPQDYPLPQAYDQAYLASDKVIFETDMNAITKPAFQKAMKKQMTFSNQTTIDQVLNQETFTALQAYLETRQIPLTAIQHLKPSAIALSLSLTELQRMGFTSEGVDAFFANRAKQDNKPQGWLETPQAQVDMLNSLNHEDANNIINYALNDIKDISETMEAMRNSWREGDMKTMEALEMTELREKYPDIYRSLLVTRNNYWIPHIEEMINSPQVEFVMVGAMHLAGPDSVLGKLKANGYTITQL